MSQTEPLLTVARFATVAEAHVARTLLEAAGLRALVQETDPLRLDPFAADPGPRVRLQVLASDLEPAREILAAATEGEG